MAKSSKKKIANNFDNIFKDTNKKSENKSDESEVSIEDKYDFNNMIYDRRLTIPLSVQQERLLEDLVIKIHNNRNNKDQRITKASIIRSLINGFFLVKNNINLMEINNEEELNKRIINEFKK